MYVRAKKFNAIFNIFLYQSCLTVSKGQKNQIHRRYKVHHTISIRFCVAVAGRAEVVPFVVN